MATLFKTMPEIQEFVTVDISGNFKTIVPYLAEANKWLLKGMDKATLDILIAYYNDENPTTDEALDDLLPFARRVLANFAYGIGVKRLGVFVGENGAMEFGNTNLTALSSERLEQVKTEFFSSGYNALEMLILFIQENKTTYADTYAYLFDNSFFVSTASDLNSLIFTDVQNRDYFEMKPDIFLIETEIEGIITAEIVGTLKEAIAVDDVSENEQSMIDLIRPAEACLAYAAKFKSEKHEQKGRELLERLRQLYATLNETTTERWSNEDKRVFVFGG